MIRRIQDQRGTTTDDPKEITHIFVAQMRSKYGPIEVTDSFVDEMVSAIRPTAHTHYTAYLEQPINAENFTLPLNPEATKRLRGPMALVGNSI